MYAPDKNTHKPPARPKTQGAVNLTCAIGGGLASGFAFWNFHYLEKVRVRDAYYAKLAA
ncbi:hypothetical protein T439DRAFT_324214, partial [Meredithblackwellia eburnea MCA 4105]